VATALAIAALAVSIVSAVAAYLSWKAANRSAGAAESADRRAREPQITILLSMPTPPPGNLVIYRVRNDGPQDLDAIVIYPPEPADNRNYSIAITGGGTGFAQGPIDLGPIRVSSEGRFTLGCGSDRFLPEFRVRVECKSGSDTWPMSRVLPPPRGEPLSEDEISSRYEVLSAAIEEIEGNFRIAESGFDVPMQNEHLKAAHRLLHARAPNWIAPIRDAVDGVTDFRVWREKTDGVLVQNELTDRWTRLGRRLSEASAELEKMRAALKPPGVPDREWRS
jgi:hypothetical protein